MPDEANNDSLLNKLRDLIRRKNLKVDKLLPLVDRVMPNKRQKMIPMELIRTDTESDREFSRDAVAKSHSPRKDFSLPPLPEFRSPFTVKCRATPTSYRSPSPIPRQQFNHSPSSSSQSSVHRADEQAMSYRRQSPITHRSRSPMIRDTLSSPCGTSSHPPHSERRSSVAILEDAGATEIFQNLKHSSVMNNVDTDSNEGLLFFMAAIVKQLSALTTEVKDMKGRIGALECEARAEDLMADDYPPNLLQWMKLEGGKSLKDHVRRVLDQMLDHDLQREVNRTGKWGKIPLPKRLEDCLKTSCTSLYTCTKEEVEKEIMLFLRNSRDRHGGRDIRHRKVEEASKTNQKARIVPVLNRRRSVAGMAVRRRQR